LILDELSLDKMTLSLNLLIFLKIGLKKHLVCSYKIDKFKNDIEVKKNVKNIIRILIMSSQEVNAG